MKVHQLLYFLEAAKQQHVGRAARILAISPSAVSHAISSLEEELGLALFSKEGKNIRLNPQGRALVERASEILSQMEKMREDLSSDSAQLQGTVRVAASHFLSENVLLPAWRGLVEDHPRLLGEVFTVRSATVLEGVVRGEFDVGLCFSPRSHPKLGIDPVYRGQLHLACRKGHPLLKKGRPALDEFPAVLPKSFQGIDNCERPAAFDRYGIDPRVELVFDNYEVAVRWIQSSNAWGLLPDWVIAARRLGSWVPEDWDAPFEICLVAPRTMVDSRFFRLLGDQVRRVLSPQPHNALQ